MSIILDALKKSEADRRIGEAPDLAQVAQQASSTQQRGGRLKWLLLFNGLALLTVLWVFWLYPKYFSVPALSGRSTETAASIEPPKEIPDTTSIRSVEPRLESASVVSRPTSPLERFVQPQVSEPVKPANTGSDHSAVTVAVEPELTALMEADTEPEVNESGSAEPAVAEIAPLGLWELPANVRADIPELRISVQVYAEQPTERFAIINGRRRQQGDLIGEGLEVAEIGQNDVVFSYQGYRFVVTR